MATHWLDTVISNSGGYDRYAILKLANRRQLLRLRPPGSKSFIVPDFQMRGNRVSPWVAPLLGSLVWIEDKTPNRDESGMERARWLYRKHDYLSEVGLAVIGHWPPHWSPANKIQAISGIELFGIGLDTKPRSFAEIFNEHPRLVVDYQYRLQGIRWDAAEYQM